MGKEKPVDEFHYFYRLVNVPGTGAPIRLLLTILLWSAADWA